MKEYMVSAGKLLADPSSASCADDFEFEDPDSLLGRYCFKCSGTKYSKIVIEKTGASKFEKASKDSAGGERRARKKKRGFL